MSGLWGHHSASVDWASLTWKTRTMDPETPVHLRPGHPLPLTSSVPWCSWRADGGLRLTSAVNFHFVFMLGSLDCCRDLLLTPALHWSPCFAAMGLQPLSEGRICTGVILAPCSFSWEPIPSAPWQMSSGHIASWEKLDLKLTKRKKQ